MGMAVVSLCLASVSIIGLRGAHMVSLDLILTYFWGVIVFVAPLLLALFACFNFFLYTKIWFKHQWSTITFSRVRDLFCVPRYTADNKCIAPLSETGMCMSEHVCMGRSVYCAYMCI
ncbi:hypothetical protein EON63_02640 [archaeon]|nr:MAG: hypothetical protein EON63_02640 [archaeon]